jgi:hypothetical protein
MYSQNEIEKMHFANFDFEIIFNLGGRKMKGKKKGRRRKNNQMFSQSNGT